jgi:hypothetical protein
MFAACDTAHITPAAWEQSVDAQTLIDPDGKLTFFTDRELISK